MTAEANMTAASKDNTPSLMQEELFNIQNKIFVSKTSILCHIFVPYTTKIFNCLTPTFMAFQSNGVL